MPENKMYKEGNVKEKKAEKHTNSLQEDCGGLPFKMIFFKPRAKGRRPYVIVKCQFNSVNTLQF